ncbi:Farnesyl-diphosphate synthase [Mycena kentingensis (nom. inval.)]|nr:Farnesyl-diphosphate synthase [Mycena kentingensis (nom. inval.)]
MPPKFQPLVVGSALCFSVLAYFLVWITIDGRSGTRPPRFRAADKRARFELVFAHVRGELGGIFSVQGVQAPSGGAQKASGMPEDAQRWFMRIMDYNVPGGKLNRGLSVVDSAEVLLGRALNDEEYFKAAVLGWGVEFLQASFLVMDDLMDKSHTRRRNLCYYRLPDVTTIAVNDAVLLEASIYKLLKRHFRDEKYYVELLELFHETTFQTATGQLLDLISAPENTVDLSKLSMNKFQLIAEYKTAYYSFYLPVALAMLMTGVPETYTVSATDTTLVHPYDVARAILLPVGVYFQVQDDFLDFAATPEQLGKVGTDIVDNKCSWAVNTALQVVNEDQRAILDSNYGRRGANSEARVKEVFEAVELRERYREYEAKVYQDIASLIERTVPEKLEGEGVRLKREVFTRFLDKIHKRAK